MAVDVSVSSGKTSCGTILNLFTSSAFKLVTTAEALLLDFAEEPVLMDILVPPISSFTSSTLYLETNFIRFLISLISIISNLELCYYLFFKNNYLLTK